MPIMPIMPWVGRWSLIAALTGGCGPGITAVSTAGTGTGGSTGEDSADETATGSGCVEDADCPFDRSLCEAAQCVACTELESCEARDPQRPVCDEASGHCLECLPGGGGCPAEAPLCSGAGECVECLEASDCPDSACDRFTSTCMPFESVYYVLVTAQPPSPPSAGTLEDPFESMQEALDSTEGDVTLRVLGAGFQDSPDVEISGPRTVVVVGAVISPLEPHEELALVFSEAAPVLHATAGARVQLENLFKYGQQEHGVACTGASLWLFDVGIGESESVGIVARDCTVHIERSQLQGNDRSALILGGDSTLSMRESVVAVNGGLMEETTALDLQGGEFDISYSTIVGNRGEAGRASISCGSATGRVRNSVITSFEPSIDCPGMEVRHSLVDTPALAAEDVDVADLEPTWFVPEFWNEAGWNLRVPSLADPEGSPMRDRARWTLGDSLVDLEGDPRVAVHGTVDYAGCDRP